jgi:transposase
VGEISELLKRLHRQVRPAIDALKHSVHQQAVVHGDETGWRENGQNGYVWCLATDGEAAIRYYEYDRRRNREVVTRLLGDEFKGHEPFLWRLQHLQRASSTLLGAPVA